MDSLEGPTAYDQWCLLDDKQIQPGQSQHAQYNQGCWIHRHCNGCDGYNDNKVVHFEVVCVLA